MENAKNQVTSFAKSKMGFKKGNTASQAVADVEEPQIVQVTGDVPATEEQTTVNKGDYFDQMMEAGEFVMKNTSYLLKGVFGAMQQIADGIKSEVQDTPMIDAYAQA